MDDYRLRIADCGLRIGVTAVLLIAVIGGCRAPAPVDPVAPMPMQDALRIVNHNAAKISGTLKASGAVDGHFTVEGRRRRYHVDATLFYLAPSYLRFDLKKFGDRQALFGCNDTHYWFYIKEEDQQACAPHDAPELLPPDTPIRPDQIGDALGLAPVGPVAEIEGDGDHPRLVQRVVDEYQQVLFLVYDEHGELLLEKEYWLDRYAPQLVRRVVFRDREGVVEMESHLDEYEPLHPGGPLLPGVMVADWPKSQAHLRFQVRQWTLVKQVKPGDIQFATPADCGRPAPGGRANR